MSVTHVSATNMAWGAPNPRNAVLDGRLVRHRWPRATQWGIRYELSACHSALSITCSHTSTLQTLLHNMPQRPLHHLQPHKHVTNTTYTTCHSALSITCSHTSTLQTLLHNMPQRPLHHLQPHKHVTNTTWTTCHSALSITYSHTITLQTLLGLHATAPSPSPAATQTRYKHYLDYMPQRPLHHLQPHKHVTNTTWTTCHSARSITCSHTNTLQTLLGLHATAPSPSPAATRSRYKHYLDYMPQRPLHHLQPHDHVTNTTWTTSHSARSITCSHTNTLQTLLGLHVTAPSPSPAATQTRYKHYLDYMPQRPLHHLQPHDHVTNTTWTTCHSALSITCSHTNTLQTLLGLHATAPSPSPAATRSRYKHYLDYMPQRPLHHLQPHDHVTNTTWTTCHSALSITCSHTITLQTLLGQHLVQNTT